MAASPLLTFGHSTAGHEQLTALLRAAAVASVVDVRTAPGSRHNPDVSALRLSCLVSSLGQQLSVLTNGAYRTEIRFSVWPAVSRGL